MNSGHMLNRIAGWVICLVLFAPAALPAGDLPIDKAARESPVVRAVQKVSPAVVNISSEYEIRERANPFYRLTPDPYFRDFFERGIERKRKLTSLGSGVIIDGKRGLILTNEHVVANTSSISAVLSDGREFKADIVGADTQSDLAVLRITTDESLPAIQMGDSSDIMIGETVIAIGNPFGFSNTVTTGVISANHRSVRTQDHVYHDFIQTDASINPGNSGGPLLNIEGNLIGINTAIYAEAQGIGFAIPINMAQKIISDLIEYGEVMHAWVGLNVQDLDPQLARYLGLPDESGIVINDIEADSPAAQSGLKDGDIIISIDKNPVRSVGEFEQAMRGIAEGENMRISVARDQQQLAFTLKAAVFPPGLAPKLAYRLLGVQVESLEHRSRYSPVIRADSGVIISKIDPQSALASVGVRPGDVIRRIDDAAAKDVSDFYDAVVRYRYKESVVVLLQRGDRQYYITLKL